MALEVKTGFGGALYHYEQTSVALTSGANTASTVTFDVAYDTIPVVRVIPHLGTGGTADGAGGFPNYAVQSVSKTGFTWNISGTGLGTVTIPITWFAHSQM